MAIHRCRACSAELTCADITVFVRDVIMELDPDNEQLADEQECRFHSYYDTWSAGHSRRSGRNLYTCFECEPEYWEDTIVQWSLGNIGYRGPNGLEPAARPVDPNRCYCNRCA
jgi:hypothetical protein